jgi:RHS repeat-associated protein
MKIRISILIAFITNLVCSQSYHDTQGKLEISNSGQATFTLPIALPPSISSVGPTINLVYASGQMGGIAGQGWSINSVSYISRIATRQDIDGFKDGVDFDDNDKLALDGQRLLIKSGTYWADGSIYETEVQSNTKIELKGTGSAIYFIVTSPDGSRSWYGNYGGMNATDLSAYYITRFEDAEGNFILYNYTKPLNKSLCIDTIQFSANLNSNTTPLNFIKFNYTTAARTEKGYLKGLLIEKVELLNNIKVYTNNSLFKEYALQHQTDSQLGYQRIVRITEKNGNGESANPIDFNYNYTVDTVNEITTVYTDSYSINDNNKLSGDFDGDGKIDVVANNNLYTKVFDGTNGNLHFSLPNLNYSTTSNYTNNKLFSISTLKNNKLNQQQSILSVNTLNTSLTEFKVYDYNNNGVQHLYTKTINLNTSVTQNIINQTGSVYGIQCLNWLNTNAVTYANYNKQFPSYFDGDYNGDGITEVLISKPSNDLTIINGNPNIVTNQAFDANYCNFTVTRGSSTYFLLDMNPNAGITLGSAGYIQITDNYNCLKNIKLVADFNGDGKSDLLAILPNGSYVVCEIFQTQNYGYTKLLGNGVFSNYSASNPLLLGDYNGDGKPDIMMPNGNGQTTGDSTWHIYNSNPNPNGGVFFEKNSYGIMDYVIRSGDDSHFYYALDVNKDGKTDLVEVLTGVYDVGGFFDPTNRNSRWSIYSYINNIGNNATGTTSFINNYHSPNNHDSDDNSFPIPFVADVKYRGLSNEMLMLRDHGQGSFARTITYINFTKDISNEILLKKVTQSNGAIVDEISYSQMQSNTSSYGLPSDFYSSNNSLNYPFVELKLLSSNQLVSQIKNTSPNGVKYQDFKYNGYSIQLNGIGSIGFLKTARCAWYNTQSDKKIWTVNEIDPILRGATKFTYTTLPSTSDFSFPSDLSSGLMSKSENTFTVSAPNIFPYNILLNTQKSTDYISGIIKEKIYNTYDSNNLPTNVTSNNYLGTTLQYTSNEIKVYDPPSYGIGSNYYIGRPHSITTTTTAYGDTKKSSQTFSYSNGNISEIDKNVYQPDGVTLDPVTMVEKMTYYSNGLLKDKEISATGTTTGINDVSPRKTSYTYDPTNRFISTIIDPEGLVSTNLSFHPIYGLVLVSKNPFNQTTTNIYDNWGKKTSVTDNALGLTTNYNYSRAGAIFTTTVTNTTSAGVSDGSSSFVEQDILGREIRKGSKNLNGTMTYFNTEYDVFGRKYRVSEPYFAGASPTQWTVYNYDDFSRPITVTSFTGKVVTNTYDGLSVTTADSVMTKSKTTDANGQVVSTTDIPGGTINYKYDANFNLLESDYDGIKTISAYDNWGRKNYYKETSEGTFTYTYDAYGEVKTEDAPKGITTYTYDSLSGRMISKSVLGKTTADGTNITSTYNFNATTKLLDTLTVLNPNDGNSLFTYTYDAQRRLTNTVETQNLLPSGTAVFTKQITFDSFSRVTTETNTATAFGKTSTKTIQHIYSTNNGAEIQLKDNTTSANLWQANSVDARNNILTASLGNGINITNTFDQFGYVNMFQHKLGANDVMTLKTTFEPILGNLSSRYNSMFDSTENFSYDSLDRLTAWDTSAETLLLLPFNTTTDGFTFTSTTTNITGSVFNVMGTLKISLKNGYASNSLQNIIITSGNKLRIKADISNKIGTAGVLVDAVMVETDPTNPNNKNEVYFGQIENGIFDAEYTATNFVPNPQLTLIFIVNSNSPNGSNGGGLVIPYAIFNVDNLRIDNVSALSQNYDDRGRITYNRIGNYNYTNTAKPYQNTSIGAVGAPKTSMALSQSITYNAFKAPIQISNTGFKSISFGYNTYEQRSVMYYGSIATDKLVRPNRRYYSADGSMEINATFASGNTTTPVTVEFVTYIGGSAYTAPVVLKSDGITYNYFYLHRDYQSSILAITNALGGVVEKRLFDPWGAIAKVQDGLGNLLPQLTFFDRGYTGHEHLQSVNLINMNARLYNPSLHRFLEADTYLQDPYNTQNYNRYGYCVNNPLKYTDVTGNLFNIATLAGCIPIVGSIFSSLLMHQNIDVNRVVEDIVITGISASVTFGIGTACSTIANFYTRMAVSALAHGVFQGGMTAANGGKFWAGFAAGAVSSIAASFWQGGQEEGFFKENDWAYGVRNVHEGLGSMLGMSGAVGTIAFGTVMGGAASALAGGNIWQGATTGLIVAGFNHLAHQQPKPKYKVINNTKEARDHYINGKGKSVVIGKESTNELRNSPEYKRVLSRLKRGIANKLNGSFDVDMTGSTFHIGDTNVNYSTTINSNGTVTTTFTEFANDGFWDPDFINEVSGITNPAHRADGMGPNLELGGTPYRYVPSTYIYTYPNPGYKP